MQQETAKKFTDFALAPDVLETLTGMGITTCTPIQSQVLGPILDGRDVVGKAETGTGKTIGFGAPLVGRLDTQRVAVQGLVLAPTRELAQQIAGVLAGLGARRGLKVALVVGGVHASEQIEALRGGAQLVVGTPGRVLDFLRERILSVAWCETAVLDEADRMLDMGFIDDVGAILDVVPNERQTLLFSATIPPGVNKILHRYMRNPELFSTSRGLATVPEIAQFYLEAEFPRKFRELQRILDANPTETAIVFCNTRRQAIDLDRMLWGHGYSAGALHGDQEQDARFRILETFRQGDIRTLVATDVASRGLDIEEVGRVINYEVPDEPEAYVHRIGRTGRASHKGIAITLVSSKERRQWRAIVDGTGFPIERMGAARVGGAADGAASDPAVCMRRDNGRHESRRGTPRGVATNPSRAGTAVAALDDNDTTAPESADPVDADGSNEGGGSIGGNPGSSSGSGRGGSDSGRGGSDSGRGGSDSGRGGSDSGRGGSDSGRGGSDSGRGGPGDGRGSSDSGRGRRGRGRRRNSRGGDGGEPAPPSAEQQSSRAVSDPLAAFTERVTARDDRSRPRSPIPSAPRERLEPTSPGPAPRERTAASGPPPARAPKQVKRKLEEYLADDLLKADYFEVDQTILAKIPPEERSAPPDRGGQGGQRLGGEPRRGQGGQRQGQGGGQGQGGQERDRSGRPRGGPPGGGRSPNPGGSHGSSPGGPERRDSQTQRPAAADGQRREGRRRRRSRSRGRGGERSTQAPAASADVPRADGRGEPEAPPS